MPRLPARVPNNVATELSPTLQPVRSARNLRSSEQALAQPFRLILGVLRRGGVGRHQQAGSDNKVRSAAITSQSPQRPSSVGPQVGGRQRSR